MFSFHDLTKNVIDFFKKQNSTKKKTQKNTSHGNIHKNIFVTVLITDSTANVLNLQGLRLQNSKSNTRSSTSLPNNHSVINVINYCYSDKSVLKALSETSKLPTNITYSRIINMEQSSSSVDELDDLSDETKHEQDEHIAINLKQDLVHTESLMIINSVAHESKLNCTSTKITLQTIDDEFDVASSGWVNVCRICHGSESTEDLIAPCRCKGSVALTHMSCLQRWLKESSNSNCELCNHHFTIIRKPKYSLLRSIVVWLTRPDIHGPELIEDVISFSLYTPSAIFATYILMLLCDHAVKLQNELKSSSAHMIAFFSIAGMAAIDFTYSSWIMMALQRHISAWQIWNKSNSHLTVVLPPSKRITPQAGCSKNTEENQNQSVKSESIQNLEQFQDIETTVDIEQNIDNNPVQTDTIEVQSVT